MYYYQLSTGLIVKCEEQVSFSDKGSGVIPEAHITIPTLHGTIDYSTKVNNFCFNVSNVIAQWSYN